MVILTDLFRHKDNDLFSFIQACFKDWLGFVLRIGRIQANLLVSQGSMENMDYEMEAPIGTYILYLTFKKRYGQDNFLFANRVCRSNVFIIKIE